MKVSSVSELKQELINTNHDILVNLCLRLARFKKENKELLTYLLFEAHDTSSYIAGIKEEMDIQFSSVNQTNVFFAKKTIRKVLRTANKHSRYSGMSIVEIELLIHFCELMKKLTIEIDNYPVLLNLYNNQVKKITKTVKTLHEDLQYDYRHTIEKL